jgi:acyl-CoA reductase-like NAD-dependent aldehyde dehydrogenase
MGISRRLCKLCVRAAGDAGNEQIAETARAMKVADGFEPRAVIGPLIDMKAVEKAEAHIAAAVKKRAKVVAGGKRHECRQYGIEKFLEVKYPCMSGIDR